MKSSTRSSCSIFSCRAARSDRPVVEFGLLAVEQDRRGPVLARAGQRVFELPFGAGHRPPGNRPAKLLGRQQHAQARPDDHDHDVGRVRGGDIADVLKMTAGDQRLAFPEQRLDANAVAEFLVESGDHPLGNQPLRSNIRRRGNEDADRGLAGHLHPSAHNAAQHLVLKYHFEVERRRTRRPEAAARPMKCLMLQAKYDNYTTIMPLGFRLGCR